MIPTATSSLECQSLYTHWGGEKVAQPGAHCLKQYPTLGERGRFWGGEPVPV